MRKNPKPVYEILFGNTDDYSLSQRLMIFTAFYGTAVGVFGTFVDWCLGLGTILVVLPIVITIIFAVFYYFSRFKNMSDHLVWPFIIISILTNSYVWKINGGYDSANIYIFFNLFMISLIISKKVNRKIVFLLFFLVGTFLFFSHYYFPDYIIKYTSEKERFFDLYLTFIYNFLIMFLLVNFSLKNYESERLKVVEINRVVEDANIELTELNHQVTEQNIELETLNEHLTQKNFEITLEQEKSEKLLLNILPLSIADRLKEGETTIADFFEEASVIFIDIVEFTVISAAGKPKEIVDMLNNLFIQFDKISEKYGIEKIKTIGDCYMAACGIPIPRNNHCQLIAQMALDVLKETNNFCMGDGTEIKFRIGIDCGPIIAGVIGDKKFIYDLWGDTVNTASRMEEYGIPGKIHVTDRFKNKLEPKAYDLGINFEERGEIKIKGKGLMKTWFLIS